MNEEQANEIIRLLRKLAGEEKCKWCDDVADSGSAGGYGYTDNFGKFHTHSKVGTVRVIADAGRTGHDGHSPTGSAGSYSSITNNGNSKEVDTQI